MKRLYLQIYLTVIVSLVLVVLAAGMMWRFAARSSPAESAFEFAGSLATAALPPASEPADVQQRALEKFAAALETDLALFDSTLRPVAAVGQPLPPPRDWRESGGWMRVHGGHAWSIALDDGRWIVMRAPHRPPPRHPALRLIGFLGAIAAAVGLGVYPIVRRLTGRMERLEAGVVSLGQGDLKTRVAVEGRDEVARLAQSFNRAAERIEALVGAHRMLLANASHELRTPLSRIRLGLELMKDRPDPRREAEMASDIAELDALIDEILLSSRLESLDTLETKEEMDLAGLAAEECARYEGCTLEAVPAPVVGDPRLVRRMIRNLLENAHRHGRPPIEMSVARPPEGAVVLRVADHGDGIPPDLREHIFEPFRKGRSSQSGSGLGLALVRQIARRHGGEARCFEPQGGGCGFEVALPAAPASSSGRAR